jgi:hypothetical protein
MCSRVFGTGQTKGLTRCFGCNSDLHVGRHSLDDIESDETEVRQWGPGNVRVHFEGEIPPPGDADPTDGLIAERVTFCRGEGDSKDYYRIEVRIGKEPWRVSKEAVKRATEVHP